MERAVRVEGPLTANGGDRPVEELAGVFLAVAPGPDLARDMVLVARRLDRLERLTAELTAAHGIRATAIPLDLSLPAASRTLVGIVDRRGLTVTSLVNNAGFGTSGPFHTEVPERLREEINVNVASVVDISRAFV